MRTASAAPAMTGISVPRWLIGPMSARRSTLPKWSVPSLPRVGPAWRARNCRKRSLGATPRTRSDPMFLIIGARRSSGRRAKAVPTEIASCPRLLYSPPRIFPCRYNAESFSSTRRFSLKRRCISRRDSRGSPGFRSGTRGGGRNADSPATRAPEAAAVGIEAPARPFVRPLPAEPFNGGMSRASEMDPAGVQVQRRLRHDLGERGVGVDGVEQLLDGRLEPQGHPPLGDQLGRLRADDVDAEDRKSTRL